MTTPTRPNAKRTRKAKRGTPKPRVRAQHRPPVTPGDIVLVAGKGSRERGGGEGGKYWHIEAAGKRSGYVFINMIDQAPFGKHPSIQIHVNQDERGRKIGQIAYRLACEETRYPKIYAHMRKSNLPSRRAAERAGFRVVDNPQISQLAMVWEAIKSA